MSIKVKGKAKVTTVNLPYEYAWASDNSCVTISNPVGTTTSQYVEATFMFANEACIGSSNITLTIIDDEGCRKVIPYPVTNPCSSVSVGPIIQQDNSYFYVSGYSPNSTITYEWNYDPSVFTLVDQVDTSYTSTLLLKLNTNDPNLPASSIIRVTGKDKNQCTRDAFFTYTICIPDAVNIEKQLPYNNTTGEFSTGYFTLPEPTGCTNVTYDWSKVSLELPDGFSAAYLNAAPGTSKQTLAIQAVNGTTPGVYVGKYTVATDKGVISNKGTLILKALSPRNGLTISVADRSLQLDCSLTSGEYFDINIEEEIKVASGYEVDWSSFSLVNPPTPTSSSITLSTDVNGDHIIRYSIPNPIVDDVFAWTICDTVGNCTQSIVYTIVDCPPDPVAVNDSATCVCGDNVIISVLSNDLGNGAPLVNSSIKVVSSPSKGVATVIGDGTIVYSANPGSSGADSFTYTVENTNGKVSNAATVNITINCAGTDTFVTLCN